MLSSPGQKSAVKPRRHDAEVVELAVSTGDLRSFPDSNNKIEQTGKRDAVCKSERCWVKGWGRTESFLAVWWGNGLILLSHTVTFNLCGILNNTAVECILSLPLWQMSICTAGWLLNGSLWEELTLSWLWHWQWVNVMIKKTEFVIVSLSYVLYILQAAANFDIYL